MPTDTLLAAILFAALVAYVLFGGADFGGGVWDLLASGPRRAEQRRAIAAAIGPIWEANHVWLILAVVLLFSGFPLAFAVISTALHVPLTLFLVGVVLRGSAFVFRGFDGTSDAAQRRYGLAFSLASVISPFLLGAMVAALAAGQIRARDGVVTSGYFAAWTAPFPLAVGALSLAMSAYLAATYLAAEVTDPALRDDFRRRAIGAGIAVGAAALGSLALAAREAPATFSALVSWPAGIAVQGAAGAAAGLAFFLLAARRHRLARVVVAGHVVLVLAGWALAQHPHLVYPDVTLHEAAAPPGTRVLLLTALAAGAPVLAPSLWLLFRIFKARAPQG